MSIHLRNRAPPPADPVGRKMVRVLVIVEGPNDVEFLRRISRILHRHARELPDLAAMEQRRELVFVPLGGGGIAAWTDRLAPLGIPEFYLFDREVPPETHVRQSIVDRLSERSGCRATLTAKRSLENYLHPEALRRAGNVQIEFEDFDPLPEFVARASFQREQPSVEWESLPRRAHKRLANRAKRWLNTKAVDQMTAESLSQRDPGGEVASWLDTIARLAADAD